MNDNFSLAKMFASHHTPHALVVNTISVSDTLCYSTPLSTMTHQNLCHPVRHRTLTLTLTPTLKYLSHHMIDIHG